MADEKDSDAGIAPPLSPSSTPHEHDQDKDAEDVREATSTRSPDDKRPFAQIRENQFAKKCWAVVTWTPKRCRWDPDDPPKFNLALNLLFGFAGTFTVANLYYSHPILNILADEFNVSDERASLVPTVMQAGYAAGLLFLCPLGDIFRRRAFVLILVLFTATIWLGLCLTKSYPVFLALSCIAAITTVTPQLMLPLVGELAPAHRRATALSIVVSGLLLGMLIARLLSGILTQYTTWRSIYWFSLGVQYLIFALLFLFMPDYPSANPDGIHYFRILSSILMLLLRSPVLVQACLIGFFTSSIFTSYWTTLTFLLASPPYSYPPVIIALFALLGISAMLLAPLYSRHITDRFIPHLTILLGLLYVLIGTIIGTYARPHSTVAGPIIQALLMDLGLQTAQIANRANIYAIDPRARNRLNTAYMVAAFSGQLTGTAAGNRLYAAGGWVRSGSASVGFVCAALVVWAARGPWEKGWVGWGGGWSVRRRDVGERTSGQGGSQGGDVESSPPPAMDKEEEKEEKNAQS